jgi:hypothetical protein
MGDHETMQAMAVEVTQFEIGPGTEAEMLATRPAAVRAIRAACGGLIDARLFRGETPGSWIDVWFWESLADARAAAATAMTLPEAGVFFSFITAPPTMTHGTLEAEDLGA